ncbi:ERG24 [Candida pseudojiufengensis]|uniref:ERG24 n=1 Tax=Candida pseudojiufengensis TaxID=497109 RepID=UPI0022247A11|nr:ERG24 [Candida pseudojiufengensis]KAI5965354.1 ERG24 [Candida pseudojiufengensis]
MSKLNPITKHKEFFGLPGALSITIFLPIILFFFALITNNNYSLQGINLQIDQITKQLPSNYSQFLKLCFNKKVWAVYMSWFWGLVVLDRILPGKEMKGTELRDGTYLNYKINGITMSATLIILLISRLFMVKNYNLPELQFIYDNQLSLCLTCIIFSFILSTFVYIYSFIPLTHENGVGTKERILSVNGNSGNPIYDWFIGRELNPRIGGWDIKLFCELRPGMLLWFLINLSCAYHQYHTLGYITDSMILIIILQAFYTFDGVLNEEGCLTMIDVTTDGFGFMLAFGDLAWLPWSYSLQTRYMSIKGNEVNLGLTNLILILILHFVGFYIFRSSNQQKSDFKNGKLPQMKSIQTKTGSKLLCDGWWGLSQHINYFGDWILCWSWCLPTGFQTPITYFYVIYFATLLIHRQIRDDMKCSAKYGEAWEKYKKEVPYKIVPYLY